ncbi:MAG: cadmium-translocating P-type ATPase [Candidatus Izimaplasma sp.]|nr:cadmium-translocating P-type ATPase [Candidatus Izimaplasma bacterium]
MNHKEHHQHMIEMFKKRFIVSLILTIPILILSLTIQRWVGFTLEFPLRGELLFVLASVIFFYGGWPFLKGAIDEIKNKNPGMMTLIALAITVAYLFSSATVFGLEGEGFFWELATLIVVMLLGHYIEMRSVLSASSALDELSKLIPNEAHKIENDKETDVSVDDLKKGDIIRVKPGEKIPVDGIIVKGKTDINESVITGESKPVKKTKDDEVIAGSINEDGTIDIKTSHLKGDNYLSKVIKLVEEAQESKSKTQNLADKAAFYLTIIAISVGVITFIVWYIISNDLAFAITRMATVMVITCPHALGLAIPLVVANSMTLSAKNGLLIRNRTAFENSRNIDIMVFDKTGTLTEGEFKVHFIETANDDIKENDVLYFAASIEQPSEHSLARGILKEAKNKDISLDEVTDFEAMKGEGVKGKVKNQLIKIVSQDYIKKNKLTQLETDEDHEFSTPVYVIKNDEVIGMIGLYDKVRDDSKATIKALQDKGIKCYMLTGDNEKTAKEVSDYLGLDGYFAEVMPDEKQEKLKELKKNYNFIAMVGDGVNDAPSLATADIGIAIGSGTDVAAETADIILASNNPKDVVRLADFGRKTYNKMVQNLIWASAYNIIAIPLAAGVLYAYGIMISPAVGAILMSFSTVIVAINAKLLKFDTD